MSDESLVVVRGIRRRRRSIYSRAACTPGYTSITILGCAGKCSFNPGRGRGGFRTASLRPESRCRAGIVRLEIGSGKRAGRSVAGWLRCSGRFLINRPFYRWCAFLFLCCPNVLPCAEGTALPLTGKAVELGRTILVPPSVARIGKTLLEGGRGHAVGLYLLLIGATCTTALIRQRGSESWVGATRSPILRRHLCVAS